MRMLVGLGNPDEKYHATRHNVGFWVMDELARACDIRFRRESRWESLVAEGKRAGQDFLLVKPATYMNHSGRAFRKILEYFKLSGQESLVILDDVFLKLGHLRFRPRGSSGGHKGLLSILESCATLEIPRLRMGVGLPEDKEEDYAKHVLSPFSLSELDSTEKMVQKACKFVMAFVGEGLDTAEKCLSDAQSKEKNKRSADSV